MRVIVVAVDRADAGRACLCLNRPAVPAERQPAAHVLAVHQEAQRPARVNALRFAGEVSVSVNLSAGARRSSRGCPIDIQSFVPGAQVANLAVLERKNWRRDRW